MIVEPYENMPAAEVGLKAGDILLEIDGKDLTGNMDVSKMLRGQVGTSFQLKVERPGEAKPLDFTIVRRTSSCRLFLITANWTTISVIST